MRAAFEELDRQPTPLGELVLRRRLEPRLQVDVYEVQLDDAFLMSSLFTVAETALATLGLAAAPGAGLDVVVGGLGLGYTAAAVLDDDRVRSLHVVDALDAVIGWHDRGLLPLSSRLTADARCRLVHGDFFAGVAAADGFGPAVPDRLHAVLVDIDHTPRHVLHPSHAAFYTEDGLGRLAECLHPGGVFALWSDDPPDDGLVAVAGTVFDRCDAHVVEFANPLTEGTSSNTVYVASTAK
ncbi:MAG TPA: spermidine synthase [Acidimicrobiales bacterium]|nr:spermidine synthase [Acidimicrobiales bacterium]